MCTLLLWKRLHPRYRLIAAANRDEFLDRPSTGPQVLNADPLVVGGRDLLAGGTWLAITATGLVVALTNRRGAGTHDAAKRSRGGLVIDTAKAQTIARAREQLESVAAAEFNPFILFAADARDGIAVHGGVDGLRIVSVDDGVHAITNWDLDADEPPKAARARRLASELRIDAADDDAIGLASRIHELLADHADGADANAALCVHRPESSYGTRSSSIVFLGESLSDNRLYHAEGPPCTAGLADFSRMIRDEPSATTAKGIVR